ncbi:hypothetical protein PPGU16_80830 (plasmid) [Paraburkholderia largidicola]|uniref:Uncharacterized protein n=1 Tax=Paraburkholderia largidicola TaxID=3014751 RepID=A0A7I8C1Q0_9BURK|nr:hypothetical protein PPGU16_80830 [Paraburkholderia sp. PGU16]
MLGRRGLKRDLLNEPRARDDDIEHAFLSADLLEQPLHDSGDIEGVQTQAGLTGTTVDAVRDGFWWLMPDTLMAE